MVIVMMLTTMKVVNMIEEIVMNDVNVLNANVLTNSAPNVNVLTLAMNNAKPFLQL